MKTFWKILAAVLAATAVYFVVVSNFERAFVCAAAGACAWLLNYRTQVREKLNETELANEEDADESEIEERNANQEDLCIGGN